MTSINLNADIGKLTRDLDEFARKQVPFATARTLTTVAQMVTAGERQNIETTFDNPRAFTKNAIGVIAARKNNPVAKVFVKDAQANYLAPSEFNTDQFLGRGKRIRTPADIRTNNSGDIPAGKLKQLLSQNGVFIGHVSGLAGGNAVSGVWKRAPVKNIGAGRGAKGMKRAPRGTATQQRKIQLLVAFTKPKPIKTKLEYHALAEKLVKANLVTEFQKALKQAQSTAR